MGETAEDQYQRLLFNVIKVLEQESHPKANRSLVRHIEKEMLRIQIEAEKTGEIKTEAKWWAGRSFYPTREEIMRNNPAR